MPLSKDELLLKCEQRLKPIEVKNYLIKEMNKKILALDGAMGTMIQLENLDENDFSDSPLLNDKKDLKGNNELLNLTRPNVIETIHYKYYKSGSDICETNTFNGTPISQEEYGTQSLIYEINKIGVEICRKAAIRVMKEEIENGATTIKYRFVAGAIGPTSSTLSISPKTEDPSFRKHTFDQVVASYKEQIAALVENNVDILMVETIFDTLNAKAAIYAIDEYYTENNIYGDDRLPLIISGTLTDAAGRTLSGQTCEAFYISVRHAKPLVIGLNCALGAQAMLPFLHSLSNIAECYLQAYPNAGLPNAMGGYDESAADMRRDLLQFAQEGVLNLVGDVVDQHLNILKLSQML